MTIQSMEWQQLTKISANRYGSPDLKKKRKEGARVYCTDKGVELFILTTKVLFIANRTQETTNIETIVSVTSIASYLTD